MELKKLKDEFSVCKVPTINRLDLNAEYTFLAVTDDEISLVCKSANAPADATHAEHGWRGLKIQGILDFSMVGVIAKIATLLAENAISIFVVSTYNTDYIFVKQAGYENAITVLAANQYEIVD